MVCIKTTKNINNNGYIEIIQKYFFSLSLYTSMNVMEMTVHLIISQSSLLVLIYFCVRKEKKINRIKKIREPKENRR